MIKLIKLHLGSLLDQPYAFHHPLAFGSDFELIIYRFYKIVKI